MWLKAERLAVRVLSYLTVCAAMLATVQEATDIVGWAALVLVWSAPALLNGFYATRVASSRRVHASLLVAVLIVAFYGRYALRYMWYGETADNPLFLLMAPLMTTIFVIVFIRPSIIPKRVHQD